MDPSTWWWGAHFGWMWIVPGIFMVACFGFMFAFMSRAHGPTTRWRGRDSAREILDRRYASGEIGKQQYDDMKGALKG